MKLSNNILSFKEFDSPFIIQFNKSEEFVRFSFLFSTQESNSFICSLTDQTYENIFILNIQSEQLLLTYYNNRERKPREILINSTINDRHEHEIVLQLINKTNLLVQFDGNLIRKNMIILKERFYIRKISFGKLDEFLKDYFNGDNFLGCIRNPMFNNRSLIKSDNRLANICQITKRERKGIKIRNPLA